MPRELTAEVQKQVAVRMPPSLHQKALKMAKREKMSFGEFVRSAVSDKIEVLNRWRKM